VGYRAYQRNSDLDRLFIAPDSELAWDIPVEDFVFSPYDRFSYSQDVISQGAISGVAEFPRVENTAGLRVEWNPAQYVFQLSYGHEIFVPETANFAYLARASDQFFGSAGWRFAADAVGGAEISASLTDYVSGQNDNRNLSAGPFVEWQMTPWFNLNLRGGVVRYSFASPVAGGNPDLLSYYVNCEARHRATEFLSHGLTLRRDVQQGLNQGSQVIEQLSTHYFIAWAFHRSVSLQTDFWYEHSREPQFGVVEIFDRYGFSLGLTAQPLKHLGVGLTYRYALKDSNFNWRGYAQNVVTMNINYVF